MPLNFGEQISANLTKDGASTSVQIEAPYNFISPPETVPPTPWANDDAFAGDNELPNLEVPIADAVNGVLDIDWMFDTDFCIGGEHKGQQAKWSGREVLPGNTIRGVLRNVMEIATASRIVHLDREARFAYRNYEAGKNSEVLGKTWAAIVSPAKMQGGILYPPTGGKIENDGSEPRKVSRKGWKLVKGSLARIDRLVAYRALVNDEKAKFPPNSWGENSDPTASNAVKLRLIGDNIVRELNCKIKQKKASAFEYGWHHAALKPHGVFSDKIEWVNAIDQDTIGRVLPVGFFPPKENRDNPYWTYIYNYAYSARVDVSEDAIDQFLKAHFTDTGSEDAIKFWVERAHNGCEEGIPVVWVDGAIKDSNGRVSSNPIYFSLSRFMRLPHKYSVGEMAAQSGDAFAVNQSSTLDFTQALMGHVPQLDKMGEEIPYKAELPETGAYKSRIYVRHAVLKDQHKSPLHVETVRAQTLSPKASFSPYYLRSEGDAQNHWSSDTAKLAGRKRYPVRGVPNRYPVVQKNAVSSDTDSVISFCKASKTLPVTFQNRLEVQNLHPVEFGGLLWALGFGDDIWSTNTPQTHRHAMGRAKPMGYGRCAVHIARTKLRKGDGTAVEAASFASYIDAFKQWLQSQLGDPFESLPHIMELKAMANPAVGADWDNALNYPSVIGKSRDDKSGDDSRLKGYQVLWKHFNKGNATYLPPYGPKKRR